MSRRIRPTIPALIAAAGIALTGVVAGASVPASANSQDPFGPNQDGWKVEINNARPSAATHYERGKNHNVYEALSLKAGQKSIAALGKEWVSTPGDMTVSYEIVGEAAKRYIRVSSNDFALTTVECGLYYGTNFADREEKGCEVNNRIDQYTQKPLDDVHDNGRVDPKKNISVKFVSPY